MELFHKIEHIRARHTSYWAERIGAELLYAAQLSTVNDHAYDELLHQVADELLTAMRTDGVLTDSAARTAEEHLLPLSDAAKAYKIRCIAHAHIDMNWQWGMPETAAITLDTFRTILELMREYPTMTFAQSQASTYRIIEQYAPEMLPEIKQRVKEGRWEVTAAAWVEADKNMTGSESLARHILYARQYMEKLLEIPRDSIRVSFEPDTFGHNFSMPEVYADADIPYMYHCRGSAKHFIYNWRARSGKQILVYREPKWYNADIMPDMLSDVPLFCRDYGVSTMLKVYGVGDHGGGPTRRDIERIIDMMQWPIQPTITFGTFQGFFDEIAPLADTFPVLEEELNYVFTGCYTSQSKIKAANRLAEARVSEAELWNAAAVSLGGTSHKGQLENAWEKILFNHFHDILPGSGVADTRDYALGIFQEAMTGITTTANMALRHIAAEIDTTPIDVAEDKNSISEGAGVGFAVSDRSQYAFTTGERGLGRRRIFHLFNPTQYDYDGVAILTAWDWHYTTARIVIETPDGKAVPHKLLATGAGHWGHRYTTIAAQVQIPPLGYATYVLDEAAPTSVPFDSFPGPRTEYFPAEYPVLENSRIRAVFERQTMRLMRLTDKASGKELLDAPSALFRYITENGRRGMTAWCEGDPIRTEILNESGRLCVTEEHLGGIHQSIRYEVPFGTASMLRVTVSLTEGSSLLDFDVQADFREIGGNGSIPQLSFLSPYGYKETTFRYDIPFGTIDRPDTDHDVPALSYAAAVAEDGASLLLVTDTKYGYRGHRGALGVNLLRASYDPDPIPEFGPHHIRIGLGSAPNCEAATLARLSEQFCHPATTISVRRGAGTLPLSGSFLRVDGDVRLYAVKQAENGEGILLRLADASGRGADYSVRFATPIKDASLTDIGENVIASAARSGNTVTGHVDPYAIVSLLVKH